MFKFPTREEIMFKDDDMTPYKVAGQELLCLNAFSDLTVWWLYDD